MRAATPPSSASSAGPAGRGPGTFETGSGLQTQVDWAHLGLRLLGDQMVELYAGGLGCCWAPAIRFASDLIRPASLERLAACLDVD